MGPLIARRTTERITFTGQDPTAFELRRWLGDLPDDAAIRIFASPAINGVKSQVILTAEWDSE